MKKPAMIFSERRCCNVESKKNLVVWTRSRFVNWTRARFPVVLFSVLLFEQSFAQRKIEEGQPANMKLEVSRYLVQADRELECNPEGAKVWAQKALDSASSARETDPAMIDTMGDPKSQSSIKIDHRLANGLTPFPLRPSITL